MEYHRILGEPGRKVLMMGNEAIARGAIEASVKVASGYPGTPSSEVLMTLMPISRKIGMYAEWAVNEKVAFEIALGAAFAGIRALATMKAPGLNVAADSVVSSAYTGVNGGLVVLVADDPGPHTTQTEQDSRWYAKLIKIPMIEPSNPQEAKDFIVKAYELSEKLQLPVLFRTTTRVNHTVGDVVLGEIKKIEREPMFEFDPKRYIRASMQWNMDRHKWLLEQLSCAEEEASRLGLNKVEGEGKYCIITSGVSYAYVKEVLTRLDVEDLVRVIKLELTYPLPEKFLLDNISECKKILIVEELDPYLEESVQALLYKHKINVDIWGKDKAHIPLVGELNPSIIEKSIRKFLDLGMQDRVKDENETISIPDLPHRPPPLCPGCPHRGSYFALLRAIRKLGYRKQDVPIMGDIGCYALSLEPPLEAIWTEHAMGASIGLALGLKLAGYNKPVIATIGDSTFFHAGLPALVEAVNKNIDILVFILDNISVAMTGHQSTPEFTYTESGRKVKPVKIEDVVRGIGVENIWVVDPYDLKRTVEVLQEALKKPGVKVVIARRECSLQAMRKGVRYKPPVIDYEKCTNCMTCIRSLGCTALTIRDDGRVAIVEEVCNGCNLCVQVCPFNAIIPRDDPLKSM